MDIQFHPFDFLLVAPALALFLLSLIPLLTKVIRGNRELNPFATLIYGYIGVVIAVSFAIYSGAQEQREAVCRFKF